MSGKKLTIEEQLERGLLLEVDLDGDGALQDIFAPVKANLGKFGQILKDSAKLIGNDIGYLVKLTFGRLKSIQDLQQMKKKNQQRRKTYIQAIAKNSDELMNSWPDGKVTSMMVAPGLFFTSEALTGVQTVTSPEFRAELAEYGADQLPFFGSWFGAEREEQSAFASKLERCEPGDAKCFAGAFAALKTSGDEDEEGVLSNLALKINKLFLFAGDDIVGDLIAEGDEGEKKELTKQHLQLMLPEIKRMIDDEYEDKRKKWIAKELKYCEKVVKEASTVIGLNMTLAGTNDSKVFFKTLEKMKEQGGDEMKDLDVQQIQSGFQEMGQKMKDDEETMKKIEEDFEESKVEKTEENLSKKLEELILSSFKSTFLQELKENLTDYYESVYTEITGGLTKEQKKVLMKDPIAKEYLSKLEEYEKKMKEAMSKVKQA